MIDYLRLMFAVVFFAVHLGLLLPAIISVKDSALVLAGLLYLVFVAAPIFWYLVRKYINKIVEQIKDADKANSSAN